MFMIFQFVVDSTTSDHAFSGNIDPKLALMLLQRIVADVESKKIEEAKKEEKKSPKTKH